MKWIAIIYVCVSAGVIFPFIGSIGRHKPFQHLRTHSDGYHILAEQKRSHTMHAFMTTTEGPIEVGRSSLNTLRDLAGHVNNLAERVHDAKPCLQRGILCRAITC